MSVRVCVYVCLPFCLLVMTVDRAMNANETKQRPPSVGRIVCKRPRSAASIVLGPRRTPIYIRALSVSKMYQARRVEAQNHAVCNGR